MLIKMTSRQNIDDNYHHLPYHIAMTPTHNKDSQQQTSSLSLFLDNLVCPISLTPLVYDATHGELRSYHSGYGYRLVDGKPLMRLQDARPLTEAELHHNPANISEDK